MNNQQRRSKTVTASTSKWDVHNTKTMCAERLLLEETWRVFERKGVPAARIRSRAHKHVRRVTVERFLADGTPGESTPCLMCRRELVKWDVRVSFHGKDGWKQCRATEIDSLFGPGMRCLADR